MADKKILVVEDNAIIAMETIERLKRLGYLISGVAATGHDAISLAASTRPDLILMDINLKGEMDGIEAAREIVAANPVPIIYLTAYSDEDTLKRAMASQPIKYLVKPYRERDLYTSIEEAFRNRPGPAAPEIPAKSRRFIECINGCEDAIFVVDREGKILCLNKKAGQITGWTVKDLMGKPLADFVSFGTDAQKGQVQAKPGLQGAQSPPCTLLSADGKKITGCAAWIPTGRDNLASGLALAVFWENCGERL